MKRLFLILTISMVLLFLASCSYNGTATIVVKNVGTLTVIVSVEDVQLMLKPDEQEEFKMTWPGHDDMHTNVISYPLAYRETMWSSESIWVKNEETKYIEVEFYPPELTK